MLAEEFQVTQPVLKIRDGLLPPEPVEDGSTEEAGGSANSGCYADDMGPPALDSAEPLLVVIEGPTYHLFEVTEVIPMLCHERFEPC